MVRVILIFTSLLLSLSNFTAQNEVRIALLIGNSNYAGQDKLVNPSNDVDSLAFVLEEELGFQVVCLKDLDKYDLKRAFTDFERLIQKYNTSSQHLVTLTYYSGHGIQVDDNNYLVPIEANLESAGMSLDNYIKLQPFLDRIRELGNFLNIMMLDACRNDPTKGVRIGGAPEDLFEGFAPPVVKGPAGMFISFSTAPKTVADSGDGRLANSPYMKSFLEHVRIPNLDLNTLFDKIQESVKKYTRSSQTPWVNKSFTGKFFFKNQSTAKASNKSEFTDFRNGSFIMGHSQGAEDENHLHDVALQGFRMAKYETTFQQFDEFCEATGKTKPKDNGWGRGNLPVVNVDWFDAVEYCNWLSEKHGLTPVYTISKRKQRSDNGSFSSSRGLKNWKVSCNWLVEGYRLPTEAEWEYAARCAGKRLIYAGTNKVLRLDKFANFEESGSNRTIPIGTLEHNGRMLYDMSGNVKEWCWDWYSPYYYRSSKRNNPRGSEMGEKRTIRGGSWMQPRGQQTTYYRDQAHPFYYSPDLGFRVVLQGRKW